MEFQRQLEGALIDILGASTAERQRMGRNAQELILQQYTWENIGNRLTRVYDWVLGEQPLNGVDVYRVAGAHA